MASPVRHITIRAWFSPGRIERTRCCSAIGRDKIGSDEEYRHSQQRFRPADRQQVPSPGEQGQPCAPRKAEDKCRRDDRRGTDPDSRAPASLREQDVAREREEDDHGCLAERHPVRIEARHPIVHVEPVESAVQRTCLYRRLYELH